MSRAVGADRNIVVGAQAGEHAVISAAGTTPSDAQRPVVAGAADVTIRPTSGLVLAAPAATALGNEPAFILLVGGVGAAHWSGRIRAARGRSFATFDGAGLSSVAGLRTPAFSAVVVTRSAGVQPRMSQKADSTCRDNRSGVPETKR